MNKENSIKEKFLENRMILMFIGFVLIGVSLYLNINQIYDFYSDIISGLALLSFITVMILDFYNSTFVERIYAGVIVAFTLLILAPYGIIMGHFVGVPNEIFELVIVIVTLFIALIFHLVLSAIVSKYIVEYFSLEDKEK